MEETSGFTGKIYEEWMREIQSKKIRGILKCIKPEPRVLDVGCGAGFLEEYQPGVYAVDIDIKNLKKARARKVLADGNHLPFKSKSFNTLFCIDVIHLLRGIKELGRVLSSGGKAVVSTFCSEYNKKEKLKWLREQFKEWKKEKDFFVGEKELDAVLVVMKDV